MEGDRGSGRILFYNCGHKASLTEELVDFLIPSFGCGWDYLCAIDPI